MENSYSKMWDMNSINEESRVYFKEMACIMSLCWRLHSLMPKGSFESGKFTLKIACDSGQLFTIGCRLPPKSANFGTLQRTTHLNKVFRSWLAQPAHHRNGNHKNTGWGSVREKCKFGIGGAHRLTSGNSKRTNVAKHLYVHNAPQPSTSYHG